MQIQRKATGEVKVKVTEEDAEVEDSEEAKVSEEDIEEARRKNEEGAESVEGVRRGDIVATDTVEKKRDLDILKNRLQRRQKRPRYNKKV